MCWDIGRFGYLFYKSRKKTLSFLCAPEAFGAATAATAASVATPSRAAGEAGEAGEATPPSVKLGRYSEV